MQYNPIYLALDLDDYLQAQQMVDKVRGLVGGLKIGSTLWSAMVRDCRNPAMLVTGFDWFLDLKWFDIPHQVAGSVRTVIPLRPNFVSLHEKGGPAMMRAAVDAAKAATPRPKILAVTTLTSLPATITQIVAQAYHAMSCGVDGIISSPLELRTLRSELGTKPILVTPGIRDNDAPPDDQHRTATAREAIQAGADYVVIGRPITQADNPRDAAKRILDSLP